MTALPDVKFTALRDLGFTGAMSDMMLQFWQDGGATSSDIIDAKRQWLDLKFFSGSNTDDWFAYLRGQGHTGQMNDMELQFWTGIAPAVTSFILTEGGDFITTEAGDNLII